MAPQSLDLQHDALRAAGVERDNIYDDLASGGRDDRPGLTACLKSLRDGDVLVVWKLDRLGRSLAHLVNTVKELSDRKIGLRVLTGKGAQIDTTTASGRMVFGIFATLAEFERDLIRERTMAGLASASARSQGRTKIRAHQSSGASRASRHGPARYFSFRSLQGTRHRARHSLPICRSQRRAQRPWKACSRTYVATRFFSQVEPPPRFIRKLKEPPLNRTNIFLVNRILTGCLSEAENLVILFFDVVTGMPSRKSHLLPAAVSSLESVTASFGSKVEVWLAPR